MGGPRTTYFALRPFTIGSATPVSYAVGDVVDVSTMTNDTVAGLITSGWLATSLAGDIRSAKVQAEPPASPQTNDLWIDSDAPPPSDASRFYDYVVMPPKANTGFTTFAVEGTSPSEKYRVGAANGDWIEWDQAFDGGTWTLSVLVAANIDRGILDVSIDGTVVGSLDTYDAAFVPVKPVSVTGVSIVSGVHTLRLTINGQNASSSGVKVHLHSVGGVKTA